jgi:hypothetical protein
LLRICIVAPYINTSLKAWALRRPFVIPPTPPLETFTRAW